MYNSALKRKWDNQNVLDYAVQTAKDEGIKEGIQESIKEERAKSEAEKVISAQLLKQSGVPARGIARALGIPVKEVEKL